MVFNYKKNRIWAESLHIVMQIGLTMAGCIAFCLYAGYKLDGWIGTRGIFTTLFIFFGIIGGANVVYRQIMEITEKNENNDQNDGGRYQDDQQNGQPDRDIKSD